MTSPQITVLALIYYSWVVQKNAQRSLLKELDWLLRLDQLLLKSMTTTSLRTNKPSSTPAHVSKTSTSVMCVEQHVKAAVPTSRENKFGSMPMMSIQAKSQLTFCKTLIFQQFILFSIMQSINLFCTFFICLTNSR